MIAELRRELDIRGRWQAMMISDDDRMYQLNCSSSPTVLSPKYRIHCRSWSAGELPVQIWSVKCKWSAGIVSPPCATCPQPDWSPLQFMHFPCGHKPVVGGSDARRSDRPTVQSLNKHSSTPSDGLVATFICPEIGSQLVELGLARLGCDDFLLTKNDCLGPLTVKGCT